MPLLQVSGVPAGPPTLITHPLNGRPTASVRLGATEVPWKAGDQVKLKFDLDSPPPDYLMTVVRVGLSGGFLSAQLVGGTGGLGKDIGAKFYRDIPAETVVRDILEECGEQVGELRLPGTLPRWVRPAGPAHEALRAVMMRYPERIWWMDHEGKVHADFPKWEPFDPELPLEEYDAAQGLYVVPFTPQLTANRHVTMTRGEEKVEKRVTRVVHSITETYDYPKNRLRLRSTVHTGDGKDQGIAGLETVTQQATRWTDYCGLYAAQVLRDHGNHTLDLRLEHPLMPDMTEVRLLQPIAGAKVKLKAGATVMLEFQASDPARPVVTGYAAAALERFELVTGRGQGIVIDDDRGQKSPDDAEYMRPHIRVADAAGQLVELWAEDRKERIKVRGKAGHELVMDSTKLAEKVYLRDMAGQELLMDSTKGAEKLRLRDKSGGSLLMDGVTGDQHLRNKSGGAFSMFGNGNGSLTLPGNLSVNTGGAATLNGKPIACVGDAVATPAGPGTITGAG